MGWPKGRSRKNSDPEVEKQQLEKYRKRKELLNEIEYEDLAKISHEAWKCARSSVVEEHKKLAFKDVPIKGKQKAVSSFLYGHLESWQMREAISKWALEHPGDMLKIITASLPKETEVTTHHDGSVVLVPARMGNVQEWLAASNQGAVDAEVVEENPPETDPETYWKERLG